MLVFAETNFPRNISKATSPSNSRLCCAYIVVVFVEYHAALGVVVAAAVVDDDDVAAVAVVDVDAKQAAVKQVRMSHRVLANTAAKVRPLVQDRVGDPGSCCDVCAGSCDAVTMMSSSPQLR